MLAAVMVAVALFTVAVVRRHQHRAGGGSDQLRGFAYVGAAGLVGLAVVVVIVGSRTSPGGPAEMMAVLGLFGYAAYLAVATGLGYLYRRRAAPSRPRPALTQRLRRRRTDKPAATAPAPAPAKLAPSRPSRIARRPLR